MLITSLVILALDFPVFLGRGLLRREVSARTSPWLSPLVAYDATINGVYRLANRVTTLIQGSPMAPQLSVTLAGVAVMVYALFFTNAQTSVLLDRWKFRA